MRRLSATLPSTSTTGSAASVPTRPSSAPTRLTLLHEATHGQLRDIDRITTNAMRQAARRKLTSIDRELMERVLEADTSPRGAP